MDHEISILPIDQITPCPQNPKLHPATQISQIARSIKQFGFINPLVTNDKDEIIAGHGWYLAALKLGLESVPIIQVSHLTEDEVRAYRLADNKIAENARLIYSSPLTKRNIPRRSNAWSRIVRSY